jgi:hypothetical protein
MPTAIGNTARTPYRAEPAASMMLFGPGVQDAAMAKPVKAIKGMLMPKGQHICPFLEQIEPRMADLRKIISVTQA